MGRRWNISYYPNTGGTDSSSPSINALLIDALEKSNGERKIDREVGGNVDINDVETNPEQACDRDYPGLFTDFERRSMEYNKLTAINSFTVSTVFISVSCHLREKFYRHPFGSVFGWISWKSFLWVFTIHQDQPHYPRKRRHSVSSNAPDCQGRYDREHTQISPEARASRWIVICMGVPRLQWFWNPPPNTWPWPVNVFFQSRVFQLHASPSLLSACLDLFENSVENDALRLNLYQGRCRFGCILNGRLPWQTRIALTHFLVSCTVRFESWCLSWWGWGLCYNLVQQWKRVQRWVPMQARGFPTKLHY